MVLHLLYRIRWLDTTYQNNNYTTFWQQRDFREHGGLYVCLCLGISRIFW